MADGVLGENLDETKKKLQALNDAGNELEQVFGDIGDRVRTLASYSSDFEKEILQAAKDAESLKKESADLAKFNLSSLKSAQETEKFLKKQASVEEKRAKLNSKIRILQDQATVASEKEAKILNRVSETLQDASGYSQDIANGFQQVVKSNDELNQKTNFFDSISEIVGDIPVLNKLFKEFGKAADKAREAAAEGKDAFTAGAKELTGAAVKAIKTFTIATFRKGLLEADERVVSLSRNLNMSEDAAKQTVRQFNRLSESTKGLVGADFQNALTTISDQFGITAELSNESAENLAIMTKYLGLSAEQSAQLAKFSAATGQEVEDVTSNLIGEIGLRNVINKTSIRYQDILKDVAGASDAIKLSTQFSGENLNDAAYEAKRLGMSLSQVDNVAASLLNFESSIASELEAELLTGRQLNLEKARQFALDNNLKGVAEEIAKQGITAEKFGKMNRIQQEAIAKALGMQREELASSLAEREAIRKFGASNKMELEAQISAELKNIELLKQQGKFKEAQAAKQALINKAGSEELVRQRENRTLAETQAEAITKLGQAADAFLPVINTIKSVFDGIATIARTIMKLFGALTLAGGNMGKAFTGVKNILGGISNTLKSVTGQADKVATATMKATGQKLSGAAAQSAVKAGTATPTSSVNAAKSAAKGGGMMGKIGGFFSKINPLKKAGSLLKGGAGKLLKIPFISSIIEGIFAGQDIQNIIAEGGTTGNVYQAIGKRSAEAIGAIGGTALGGVLGSALGPIGTVAAGILGDTAGRWVGGQLAEQFGAEGLGKFVAKTFGYDDTIKNVDNITEGNRTLEVDDFTIRANPKDTLVMAGGTRFGEETNALLKELITLVREGGDVYIDGSKVGKTLQLASSRMG